MRHKVPVAALVALFALAVALVVARPTHDTQGRPVTDVVVGCGVVKSTTAQNDPLLAPLAAVANQRALTLSNHETRMVMRRLIAFARRHRGVAPLRGSALLHQSAVRKARDIALSGQFAHAALGRPWDYWINVGRYPGVTRGENLAWGTGALASPRATMAAWLASPGHRSNILYRGFNEVGLGLRRGAFRQYASASIWVMHLGGRAANVLAARTTVPPKMVVVDRARFRLRLYIRTPDRYRLVKAYKVGVGRPGYATPLGAYWIAAKARDPSWTAPDSPWVPPKWVGKTFGPNDPRNTITGAFLSLAGGDGVGIHGTKIGGLGERSSHGCVRMSRRDVLDLYRRVPIGTPVVIE